MRIGTASVVGAALAAAVFLGGEADARALVENTVVEGKFMFFLDVTSASGGEIAGGIAMGKELYQWIQASFDGQAEPKDGALVTGSLELGATSRRPFEGAWVSGVSFAGLDVASEEGKKILLVLDADLGPPEPASGPLSPPPKSEALIHGFRLAIEGLPGGSAARVGPLHVTASPSGGLASNLVFEVPLAQGAPFYAWLAAPAAPPKAAALDYVNGSNGVVAALRLGGLTPVSVAPVPGSNPPRVRVEASSSSASFAAIL